MPNSLRRARDVSLPARQPTIIARWLLLVREGLVSGAAKALGAAIVTTSLAAIGHAAGALAWTDWLSPLLWSFMGAFLVTMLDYWIRSAKGQIDRWDWSPSNSLRFRPGPCALDGAGRLSISVDVFNASPVAWTIEVGSLNDVTIGSAQIPEAARLKAVVNIPARSSAIVEFVAVGVRPAAVESTWVLLRVGKRATTLGGRPTDTPGGSVGVMTSPPHEPDVAIGPLETAICLASWKEGYTR